MLHKIAVIILTLSLLSIISLGIYIYYSSQPPNNGKEIIFKISKGSTIKNVAKYLEDKEIIRNANILLIYFMLKGYPHIKAGTYKLRDNMTTRQIFEILTKGKTYKEIITITIPEGYTVFDIAKLLSSKTRLGDSKSILKYFLNAPEVIRKKYNIPTLSIEGYLFPSTYKFDMLTLTLDKFVNTLINELFKRFPKDEVENKIKKYNLNYHQWLTLGSLVEAEAKVNEERPKIAAVYLNRLRRNMILACDPTVKYALMLKGLWHKGMNFMSKKYKYIKSPYNTYVVRGLPPGPINNPGEASLNAILITDINKYNYLYFVLSDKQGHHVFSRDFLHHSINVKKYKKLLRQWRKGKKQ